MFEKAVNFSLCEEYLCGILHLPEKKQCSTQGVLVVVGGPQCRVGSHRQFVLLARYLASRGIPVFRFDYRGMGDSTGQMRDFEDISLDIKAAIDCFFLNVSSLKEVAIWGLCDAASAGLIYAHQDPRVTGLVLLNPWVRTDEGEAQTYIKSYYFQRFFSQAFWKKLFTGKYRIAESLTSFLDTLRKGYFGRSDIKCDEEPKEPLPDRMLKKLQRYSGGVLVILSGNDYVADEFRLVVQNSKGWQDTLSKDSVTQLALLESNHTFSSQRWRDQVAQWTYEWIIR